MGVDARPRKSNVSNLVQKTAFKSSLCHRLIANSPVIEPTVEESFRLAPKTLTMLSCRAGHSRFRHFLGDFGECRFGRLFLGFLFIHSFHDVTSANRSQINLDQQMTLWHGTSDKWGGYAFSSFQVF
jgi:hypothetical protein